MTLNGLMFGSINRARVMSKNNLAAKSEANSPPPTAIIPSRHPMKLASWKYANGMNSERAVIITNGMKPLRSKQSNGMPDADTSSQPREGEIMS